MPLQDQELAVAFGQGLDKKTDSKAVVPGKLLLLENGVFTEGHQVAKRYGYSSITNKTYSSYSRSTGTLSAPVMVKSYNNELLCADNRRLWSYSPTLGAWIDKGQYESIASLQQNTSAPNKAFQSQSQQSSAILGNYLLLTWVAGGAYAAVIDLSTGTKILPDTLIAQPASGGSAIRPVALGSTRLAIFYIDSSNHLSYRFLNTSSNSVVFDAAVTLETDIVKGPASPYNNVYPLEVVNTATGAVLAYDITTPALKIITLDTSATVTHSISISTTTKAAQPCIVSNATDGRVWVYWQEWTNFATGSKLYYAVVSSSLSSVLGRTLIVDLTASHQAYGFGAVADSISQQTLAYTVSTGGTDLLAVRSKILTDAGVISTGTFYTYGVDIISKPFYVGAQRYIYTVLRDINQPTVFLVNMDAVYLTTVATTTGCSVGRALTGTAQYSEVIDLGVLPAITQLATNIYAIHSAYLSDAVIAGAAVETFNYSSTLVKFDWNNGDAYQGVPANGELVLNGGALQLYDGASVAELGFSAAPTFGAGYVSGVASGGSLPDGTYTTYLVYQWVDNQANVHQISSVPAEVTITGSTGHGSIQAQAYSPILTTKDLTIASTITVQLYHTVAGGTAAYLGAQAQITVDAASASSLLGVTLTSSASAADLVACTPLYINGNVLANDPPPAAMILNSHNNRIWAVDSTHPFDVSYTKTLLTGAGIAFSGNLVATIDNKGGAIGGLAALDDKEIVFKVDNQIAVLYGDGANDTGQGSTLSNPQFLQTDVGCAVSKSILRQPNGIIFKSPKGWYLLDRSTQVQYIGYPVETYNTQDVTSAIRVKDKTLCIFLTSSGYTLAYDYFFNQWSTFTNHTGYAADIFQDLYTYVRADGSIYQQNTTSYLDAASSYILRARTSWLNMGKIQNFQRVKKVLNLGDHLSPATGHGVQISAAYDFVDTFSTPVVYTFPDTGGPYQYSQSFARQKCDTISLLIEEVSASSGQTGEYIDFTDLGFEAGMKKGPNKLPASRSVG